MAYAAIPILSVKEQSLDLYLKNLGERGRAHVTLAGKLIHDLEPIHNLKRHKLI